jgi:hypothetical protein
MLRARVVAGLLCVGSSLLARDAGAQTTGTGLLNQMYNLFVQSVILSKTPAGNGVVAHTPVFLNDPTVLSTTALVSQVSQQIGSQISVFPLGSSSGGFTYVYDATLGTFSRTTDTFGPAFAERAVTSGRGKFAFGMNYVHASYNSLDGKDLQNGDIKFILFHQKLTPPSFVEGDVIQAALGMNLKSDTTAFLFNYGVTDRFDVGLAIPLVHVSMNLTYHAAILDFATHVVSPSTHLFGNGSKTADFAQQGSASGVGDIVVRGKYDLLGNPASGLAAAIDLHLPSGKSDDMLGAGGAQAEVYLIGSGKVGRNLSPHFNLGYTAAKSGLSNQVNYVGGVEIGVSPRVTVDADLVGRTFTNVLRINDVSIPHSFQQGQSAAIETTTLQTIAVSSGNLTSGLGAVGVKLNPWRNLLVSGQVLFPLNNAGLVSHVSPVVGFSYDF